MNYEIPSRDTVILITHDGMGNAEPDLSHKLLGKYLRLLVENDIIPAAICFYTEGVKMATAGSPVLNELRALEEQGVYLLLCGTCLNYYDLVDQMEVGIQGGMTDIIEAQWRADHVITL